MVWTARLDGDGEPVGACGRGGDGADARDHRRDGVDPHCVDERVDGRRRGEGDDVGIRDRGALLVGDGRGWVRYASTTSTSQPAAAETVGQHVAGHRGAGEQDASRSQGRARARRAAPRRRSARAGGRPGCGPRAEHGGGAGPMAATFAVPKARASGTAASDGVGAVGRGDHDPVVGVEPRGGGAQGVAPVGRVVRSRSAAPRRPRPRGPAARPTARRLRPCAGDHDPAAEQRAPLEPGQVDARPPRRRRSPTATRGPCRPAWPRVART